ncbi:MAG: 2-C-methyl-D-erythritol 4-phosphate cytidylyltransferase [Muribaculaceae bacterium]|nr:2-C-methyl-D-erythritol 4-phosphate cytidylyltransferase [Muribaculaceae bacterium]
MDGNTVREHIIIVAAGTGSRFGASVPKQYCSLAGEPVLLHTLRCLSRIMPDAGQILVISEEMESLWLDLCRRYGFDSPDYVFGGPTRFHSVKSAIDRLEQYAAPDDYVFVHDAARPIVRIEVIDRLRESLAAGMSPGCVPVVAMSDSLRRILSDGTTQAVDRSLFRAVQTPQAFRMKILAEAYRQQFDSLFTDDASVVERYTDRHIDTVEGSPDTLKITNARDLTFVSTLL